MPTVDTVIESMVEINNHIIDMGTTGNETLDKELFEFLQTMSRMRGKLEGLSPNYAHPGITIGL